MDEQPLFAPRLCNDTAIFIVVLFMYNYIFCKRQEKHAKQEHVIFVFGHKTKHTSPGSSGFKGDWYDHYIAAACWSCHPLTQDLVRLNRKRLIR